jgi:hypothetical protein
MLEDDRHREAIVLELTGLEKRYGPRAAVDAGRAREQSPPTARGSA